MTGLLLGGERPQGSADSALRYRLGCYANSSSSMFYAMTLN
jgi:hypothetical protein